MKTIEELGKTARKSSRSLARANSELKNDALNNLADLLSKSGQKIFAANELDIAAGIEAGLSEALLDRLTLNPARLSSIISDLRR